MTDYISREAALQALCEAVHAKEEYIPCRNQIVSCQWKGTRLQEYAEKILAIPAADVRPVVLCRDCKYYRLDPIESGQMICVKDADEVDGYFSGFLSYTSETWFCADGANREES